MNTGYVYTLLLEEGYWYVGYTGNIPKRMEEHFSGLGSRFTVRHPPIAIVDIFEGSLEDEEMVTLIYMSKFGYNKVKGSIWAEKGFQGKRGRVYASRRLKALMEQ